MAPYGPKVTPEVAAAADKVKQAIIDGTLHPFTGPITDQKGKEQVRRRQDSHGRAAGTDELVGPRRRGPAQLTRPDAATEGPPGNRRALFTPMRDRHTEPRGSRHEHRPAPCHPWPPRLVRGRSGHGRQRRRAGYRGRARGRRAGPDRGRRGMARAGRSLAEGSYGRRISKTVIVMPGFVDTHIHYSQVQVIASYGAQLLEWLQKYTFVEEQKFGDPAHAAAHARFFLDELLRNGTTTAVVYCTVHPGSVDAFFAEARGRDMRMLAGKVLMDRNAPPALTDTAERGYLREQGADRALARRRPAGLRRHAALRHHLDRCAARSCRCPGSRASGLLDADASVGEPERDRDRRCGCSRGPRTIPTSTTASACSAGNRCLATASI